MGDGNVNIVQETDVYSFGTAFVNFDLGNYFSAVIKFGRINACNAQLSSLLLSLGACFGRFCTGKDGNNTAVVAFAGSGKVIACAFRIAGFQTVDTAVAIEQKVSVGLLDIIVFERFICK